MDDLVEHVVALPGRELLLLAPRDGEALLSEEAFEQEEFLPYWAELWPSALALARVVARRPLTGRRTIELGCGLGLPAIAAAAAGGARARDRLVAGRRRDDGAQRRAQRRRRCDARPFRWDARARARSARRGRSCSPPTCSTRRATSRRCWRCCRALTAARGEVWLADPGRAPAARLPRRRPREHWRIDAIPHDGPARTSPPPHRAAPPSDGAAPSVSARGSALSRASDCAASRSAAPATSTRPAMRPSEAARVACTR